MIGWCSPPPYPLPTPILTTDFLGLCPCPRWGWVGARAGLVLGMITLPSTPLPSALFFFGGVPMEGGLREALRYPDLPRPLPHLSTPGSNTLLARLESWGREGGGGRSRDQRPPYHPTYASNPHNAPAPTRTISGTLSQWPFSRRLTGLRAPELVSGGGGCLGGSVVH